MSDPTSQHCHLQSVTTPPFSNSHRKTLKKDLMRTMTVTMTNKRRKKEEPVVAGTTIIQWHNNINNSSSSSIHMCPAVHIIYNQNQTKCTLPTSTAAVCSHIFQHLWLPTYIHKLRFILVYTHTTQGQIFNLWFTGMLATVTHLPLIINLTVQHQWVTFCLVYVDWQQKHELVTL